MAIRPGTNIVISESPPVRSAPTDTGVWFVVGLAERGDNVNAIKIENMSDYSRLLGDRVSYGALYDALDVFFREGGSRAYVARVTGPAVATAFKVLNDAGAVAVLRVEAKSPGAWGNSLRIAVLTGDAGGEFKLQVSHATLGILETSPSLADKAAAFAWAANSDWIKLVDQAGANDPAVIAAQALASGADDQAGITDAHWETALSRFPKSLGPGQVSYPGRTTDQAHVDLLEHAQAYGRVAIMDAPDTATKATLLTNVTGARTANARWGALFGPWLTVPGITSGTTRTVPPSPLVAACCARVDGQGSPNKPGAGQNGEARYAIALTQGAFVESDRTELNDAGFNALIVKYGAVRVYGWRTLANPVTEVNWKNLGNVRLVMAIAARADEIGEGFVFDEIDGQGRTLAAFNGALTSMLNEYWQEGSLYGATPGEAFFVDTGPAVNTPARLSNGELWAVLQLRMSPFAEMVTVQIVKTPITEEVAA